jgi:hypothetical protein
MKFSVDRCLANGDGMYGFCGLDVEKFLEISQRPVTFILFTYLFLNILKTSYLSNRPGSLSYISYDEFMHQCMGKWPLTPRQFLLHLQFLQKNEYIGFEKVNKNKYVTWLKK